MNAANIYKVRRKMEKPTLRLFYFRRSRDITEESFVFTRRSKGYVFLLNRGECLFAVLLKQGVVMS